MDKIEKAIELLQSFKENNSKTSPFLNWKKFGEDTPPVGYPVLVKSKSGEVKYAIYSSNNELDVHEEGYDDRGSWFKFSSRTYPYWYPLNFIK